MKPRTMTLCIVHKDNKVLLDMKKRGFGEGRWNGFGGKVLPQETIEQGMLRECLEEGKFVPKDFTKFAVFNFNFPAGKQKLNCVVHVFKALDFDRQPQETEEMKPHWFAIENIPYDNMWSDDKIWLPLFLQGKKLKGEFYFNEDDELGKHYLQEVDNF